MPLAANLLHHYLLGRHPAKLLIAIKDNPNSTGQFRNHTTYQWLQHACLAKDEKGDQSALHITVDTSVPCDPGLAAQITSDIKDVLLANAELLIKELGTSSKKVHCPPAPTRRRSATSP